jgi:hypothetical protein
MVDLYGLAHVAARRQSMFSGTLQEMETTCDLTPLSTNEDEEEDDEVDPTRPAA